MDSDAEKIAGELILLVNQFSRKAIEMKVRDSAAHVKIPVSLLNQAKSNLFKAGSFSALVKDRQVLSETDSFKQEWKNFCQVVRPFSYERVQDIALNGVKIPGTETFYSLIPVLYEI